MKNVDHLRYLISTRKINFLRLPEKVKCAFNTSVIGFVARLNHIGYILFARNLLKISTAMLGILI